MTNSNSPSSIFLWIMWVGLLSGCLGAEHDQTQMAAITVEGNQCLTGADACSNTPSGLIIKPGAEVAGAPIGIWILNPTGTIRIVNASIAGTVFGILVEGSCNGCAINVENGQIDAAVGILVAMPTESPQLSITNSEIVATSTSPNAAGMSGTAVRVQSESATLQLDEAELKGAIDGIAGRGGDLRVSSTSFSGFLVSISGFWNNVHIGQSSISCVNRAITIPVLASFRLHDTIIQGCQQERSYAIGLGTVLGIPGQGIKMDNLTLRNSYHGLWVGGFDTVSVTNSSIADNAAAGMHVVAEEVRISRTLISGNRHAGATIEAHRLLEVVDSDITNNGEDEELGAAGLAIAGRESGTYTVSRSNIEGNRVWGLHAQNFDTLVVAADNWWGSPLGPSPATPAAIGNPLVPGFGDSTLYGVVTEPHRVSRVVHDW